MKKILLTSATALTFALAGTVASAQGQNCARKEAVVERLTTKYGEKLQAHKLTTDGLVVEMYVNEESGSWTDVLDQANGFACLVAAGNGFEWLPVEPAEEAGTSQEDQSE